MGFFDRITDIFKANVNDILDKAEDPEKMIKQMVIEMEESVNKSTLSVAQAVANERKLEKKIQKAESDVSEWMAKAKQAIEAGRDDLAKAALEKKSAAERNLTDLKPIHEQAKATADKLRSQLDQLKSKLDEARTRQSTLIARAQTAKTQKQLNSAASGVGSDAFSKFDKFENKVEELETQAEVMGELGGNDASLDEEFKQLGSSSADDELLKLKSEMGLLPGNDK